MSFDKENSNPSKTSNRIQHDDLLDAAIRGIIKAVQVGGEYTEQEIIEATYLAKNLITSNLEDEQWRKDLEASIYEREEDNRPTWCGIPIGSESKKVRRYDYYKMLNAIMNLLHRRDKLSWRDSLKPLGSEKKDVE